jgi:GNAT superfamily N-acetyltransferase
MEYSISTDKSRLDVPAIQDFLSNRSYWAKGRSFDNIKKSIDNSLCYGLYDSTGNMLGFARVVTDKVAFAYLMDVFILEAHRGKGLGKMLIKHILAEPELQVKFWLLGTVNAHGLYEQLGFTKLSHTERYMEIKDPARC